MLVLEEQDQYSFDAQGRQTYKHYSLYKILTQAGADNWDVLASYWEPSHVMTALRSRRA